MSRSFTVESAALGLGHLTLASNNTLSEKLTRALKDFSSRLRKKAESPIPHHLAVKAISNAAGFPTWEAFVSAVRRLAATAESSDRTRSGFCDALPLLVVRPNFHASPEIVRSFNAFVKRVQGHSGYPKELVETALAEHWGEASHQAMLARSAPESAMFLLEISADAVWPKVVGPLRDVLEDKERKEATNAAVRAAALRDAKAHASNLERKLRALGKHFPEQQQLFLHAKTLKELPWGRRAPAHEADYDLCAAFGYWKYCTDVAGKEGSRTWKQFRSRSWSAGGEPDHALKQYPLLTEVPCPACSKAARVEVALIASKDQRANIWKLTCGCGHEESRSPWNGMFASTFAADSAFVTCDCLGCATRREVAARLLAPFSADIEGRLSKHLTNIVDMLEAGETGQQDVQLTQAGEVLASGEKICDYREQRVSDNLERESVIGRTLKARTGGYVWPTPISVYLETEHGFERVMHRLFPKDMTAFVFREELRPLSSFHQIKSDEEKQRYEDQMRQQLNQFLSGFTAGDLESFKQWLNVSQLFLGRWWFTVPVFTAVGSSEEAMRAVVSNWSKRERS